MPLCVGRIPQPRPIFLTAWPRPMAYSNYPVSISSSDEGQERCPESNPSFVVTVIVGVESDTTGLEHHSKSLVTRLNSHGTQILVASTESDA